MILKKQLILISLLILAGQFQRLLQADEFYKEINLIGGYSENEQWIGKKGPMLKNSIGFEYYKKFSNEYGDYLTLDLQVRMAYDSIEDSDDAFGVEIHNAWLDYKLGLGKSIRFGHFDPAFGLEPALDTHATLLQTLAMKNVGFKKDWGVGYYGLLGDYDIQLAAGLGSGIGIETKDGSYLLSGRISTPQTSETQIGLSILYGKTLQSAQSWTIPSPDLVSSNAIQKKRFGIDLQSTLGLFDLKAEAAIGDDEGKTVAGGMVELGYTVPENQELTLKQQVMYWSNDWEEKNDRDLMLSPVIEYKLNSTTTVRLGYFYDLYSSRDEDQMIILQWYYFGA